MFVTEITIHQAFLRGTDDTPTAPWLASVSGQSQTVIRTIDVRADVIDDTV